MKVRYNGGHALSQFIMDQLNIRAELVKFCPEVGCGLPVPREPMDLYAEPGGVRVRTVGTGEDMTDLLTCWSGRFLDRLENMDIAGFILKSGSPSCSRCTARLHSRGVLSRSGTGIFAKVLMKRFPEMPVAEEGELATREGMNAFLERTRQGRAGGSC